MLFNSISFIVFFPTVFFCYWMLPERVRPFLLLVASCYFYMAFVPYYILVLFYLITLDFFLGRAIEHAVGHKRRALFLLSIFSNIGTLVIFKYFNFFNADVASLASFLHWNYSVGALSLILPLGLSFHIFQSLAYIIEVYKGRFVAEKNYFTYALYVMFFPQLVAGPIERPAQLLPQLRSPVRFDYDQTTSGLKLMAWGLFKKIVIGNNLATLVDFVYSHLDASDSSVLLLVVVAFSFELYADFSGYSDIAIGSARMLGIELVQNFRRPYFSRSTSELWNRWHISLSSWFRDYLYIPIGGNRVSFWRRCVNVLIVFAVMGLWHGAGWNYIVMGLLFGLYICVGLWTENARQRLWRLARLDGTWIQTVIQIATTFALTSIAWVFFQAKSLSQAIAVVSGLITRWHWRTFEYLTCSSHCATYSIGIQKSTLAAVGMSVALMLACEFLAERSIPLPSVLQTRAVRWPVYYAFVLWILFAGYFVPRTFIYFQF